RVEVIKCLSKDPRVVILDEPTSVLTQAESRRLFEVLRALVHEEGRAVVLISHRLEEILEATDRVTVMRDGQVITTIPTESASAPGRRDSGGPPRVGLRARDERHGEPRARLSRARRQLWRSEPAPDGGPRRDLARSVRRESRQRASAHVVAVRRQPATRGP